MTGNKPTYRLFNPSGCLSPEGMERYLADSLSAPERELASGHIAQCGLCRDALEGLAAARKDHDLNRTLSDINARIAEKYGITDSLPSTWPRPRFKRTYYRAAAATLLVLVGLTWLLNSTLLRNEQDRVGQVMEVTVKEVPPVPTARPGSEVSKPQTEPDALEPVVGKEVANTEQEERVKETGREKLIPETAQPENDAITAGESLEEFMTEEESGTGILQDEIRYQDIASTLPVEYYLAEVIVSRPPEITSPGNARESLRTAKTASPQRESIRQEAVQPVKRRIPDAKAKPGKKASSVKGHFFKPVESMPAFPGGYDALVRYLSTHLNYPEKARKEGITGRVLLTFIIDGTGQPVDITVVSGIGGGCDEEAARVIRSMPKWEPARQNGQPVPVRFTLPVSFRMI